MTSIAVFSAKSYDQTFFDTAAPAFPHLALTYFEAHLNANTVQLASGFPVVCVFPNDTLDAATLEALAAGGTRLIALRCAGYNNVDLNTAQRLGLRVVRVPAYSPHAVAEMAVALLMTLNRKTHRAFNRVREGNFSLEGLMGFDVYGKTVGIIGTGAIGVVAAQILKGFGCRVLAYDPYPNATCKTLGVQYVELPELYAQSDIISLHCPLTPETFHLINAESIAQMKRGVVIINTSRGATLETTAVIDALKSGQIGALGLDVYEEEADLFFEDLSDTVIQDDVFMRLLTFPNVLITGHQAFLTREALQNIVETTLQNVTQWASGEPCPNELMLKPVATTVKG